MLCEKESGDALLCLPCKEALEAEEAAAAVDPLKSAKFVAPPKRSAAAMVGEVTVFSDGSIVAPEVEGELKEEAEAEGPETAERPAGTDEDAEPEEGAPEAPPLVRAPVIKRPIERKPAPEERKAPPRTARRPAPKTGAEVEPAGPPRVREVHTGPIAQFAHSLPYGVGAGIIVAALWLLFAMVAKQWSQIAVFTMGIVVPWAFYKGSTMRKKDGERVWSKAPRPLLLAIPSVVVVAAITPAMEWLAFKLIYGANPARLPFSDFMERYFKGLDWVLVGAGIALAFLIPFMLKSGEGWRKPSVGKPVEEEAEGEEEDEEPSGDEAVKPEPEPR